MSKNGPEQAPDREPELQQAFDSLVSASRVEQAAKKPAVAMRSRILLFIGVVLLATTIGGLVYLLLQSQPTTFDPDGPLPLALRESTNLTPVAGGTLRLGQLGELRSLDPLWIPSGSPDDVHQLLYETLVEFDRKGEVVPSLARSWQVDEEQRRFSLSLRGDVRFHDNPCFAGGQGRSLAARDVVRSLSRFFAHVERDASSPWRATPRPMGTLAAVGGGGETIAGIVALDTRTVEVRFSESAPGFLQMLTQPALAILPEEAVDAYETDADLGFDAVGTGPFRLDSVTGDGELVLGRHPAYWRGDDEQEPLPYLEQIVLRPFRDGAEATQAFEDGDLDLLAGLPAEDPGDGRIPRAGHGVAPMAYRKVSRLKGLKDPASGQINPVRSRLRQMWLQTDTTLDGR